MSLGAYPATAADHLRGSLRAPFVIVEYGDFECPYCAEAYPQIQAAMDIAGSNASLVFRQFPWVDSHPHAMLAARFTEAAATIGRFWQMHDWLFEHPQSLDADSLVLQAKALGFSGELVDAVLAGDFAQEVEADLDSGIRSGVNATPCLFVNGRRYDGPRDADSLVALCTP